MPDPDDDIDSGEMVIAYVPVVGAPMVEMRYKSNLCKFLINVSPAQAKRLAEDMRLCKQINEAYLLHASGVDADSDIVMEIGPETLEDVAHRLMNAYYACKEFTIE
jgi:hypothetical protein